MVPIFVNSCYRKGMKLEENSKVILTRREVVMDKILISRNTLVRVGSLLALLSNRYRSTIPDQQLLDEAEKLSNELYKSL